MNKIDLLTESSFKEDFITAVSTYPIVYVKTYDYLLVEQVLASFANSERVHNPLGAKQDEIVVCDTHLNKLVQICSRVAIEDKQPDDLTLNRMMAKILYRKSPYDKKIFIFTDVHKKWDNPVFVEYLERIAHRHENGEYKDSMCVILLDNHSVDELPSNLDKFVSVVDITYPTLEDIEKLVENQPISIRYRGKERQLKEELTRTLLGLDYYEIETIFRAIKTCYGNITRSSLSLALEMKKNIVKKSGLIEVVDTDVLLDDVGGLSNLVNEVKKKSYIFRNLRLVGRKNNKLPYPKGFLIIGMPGCGKSLIAKAISNSFGTSLIRLDVNKLMGKYVGESEENLRNALRLAEMAQPCVLWIDEVEKAFAGSSGRSDNDTLVQRLMGQFLTWMQERQSSVFVVATANDVMKPEFMRKGRFDEVFFVDFPSWSDAQNIVKKKIERYKDTIFDVSEISETENLNKITNHLITREFIEVNKMKFRCSFAGSEIEYLINSVIEESFIDYLKRKEDDTKEPSVKEIKVTTEQVIAKAKEIAKSIMALQEDEKSPICKIREMQSTFNFMNASK